MSAPPPGSAEARLVEARDLLVRADELAKAAPGARDSMAARERARGVLEQARNRVDDVLDELEASAAGDEATAGTAELRTRADELALQVARRMLDLDGADLAATTRPSPGMRRAPTTTADPGRRPPGQHLTPGFPVLHVGAPPTTTDGWTVTVTGRVRERRVFHLDDLRREATTATSDFHCVTGWSRLDNQWTGVPVVRLLAATGPRPEATHAVVAGHPAYTANLSLAALRAEGVLLAWAHDGRDLPVEHGGPLRLVVPQRYGWKSVKWVTEIRLVDRDVPGYWEERGYHMHADPWREQRLRGD